MDHVGRGMVDAQLTRAMAASGPTYQRLTRNTAGVGMYASLWLADDHVMVVRSSGYHESYARLQLSDMKAIFLTKTDRRLWWGIFWGIIAGWSGIVLFITLQRGETPIVSAIIFGTSLAAFLWNHFLGEGCRAFVLTGVQTAELPSLVRMKKGRQVIARLQPLILQAQTDLGRPPPMPAPVAERPSVPTEPAFAEAAADQPGAAPPQPEIPPQPPPAG